MTTYTHVLHSSAVSWGKNPSYALPYYELSLYVLSEEHTDALPYAGSLGRLEVTSGSSRWTGCYAHTSQGPCVGSTQRSWYCHRPWVHWRDWDIIWGFWCLMKEVQAGIMAAVINPHWDAISTCVWVHVYTRISSCHRTTAPHSSSLLFCSNRNHVLLHRIFVFSEFSWKRWFPRLQPLVTSKCGRWVAFLCQFVCYTSLVFPC